MLLIFTGITLIGGLSVDVAITVFHPQGHGGPVSRALNRTVWRLATVLAASGSGDGRSGVLALCGPVLAPLTIIFWGIWLVIGFAFLYAVPGVLVLDLGDAPANLFVDALYYSGYVATTLGLGDVIAVPPWARLATVVQAVFGFALFAVVVTYVLSIYRELLAAQTLALQISVLTSLDSEPRGLARWDKLMCRELLRASEAHGQFPVLHYFRPRDPARWLVLQVARSIRETRPQDEGEILDLVRAAVRRFLVGLHTCLPRRSRPSVDEAGGDLLPLVEPLLEFAGHAPRDPEWEGAGPLS